MSDFTSSSPLVSIIIPTYNRALCIDRAVSSVINQTLTDWELIIIDNNSTDNTIQIVNNFADKRISVTKIDNHGIISSSRNLGIDLARGTFVAFLDSDDWWTAEKLEISVSALKDGNDIVYHDLYKITKLPVAESNYFRVRTRVLSSPVFSDLLSNGNALNNSSVVVRKSLLQDINGFSVEPELVGSEDFDGWIRISKLTEKFERLEGVLGYYWDGGGNLSSPERALLNAGCLREMYATELKNLLGVQLPGWMLYSLAKSSVSLGEFTAGRKYSWLALNAKLPKFLKVKAAIFWLMALTRIRG